MPADATCNLLLAGAAVYGTRSLSPGGGFLAGRDGTVRPGVMAQCDDDDGAPPQDCLARINATSGAAARMQGPGSAGQPLQLHHLQRSLRHGRKARQARQERAQEPPRRRRKLTAA